MPKQNQYFIPKENYKKVEEVRELENKELITPEEQAELLNIFKERQNLINNKSKLSPAARTKLVKRHGSDYLSERAFNRDIALSQMYGPGFWDDYGGEIFKKVGSIALATTYFTPLGVVTAPMTAVAVGTGGVMWAAGKASDNDELKKAGGIIFGTAFDAAVDGLSAGTLNAGAPAIAKLTKTVCKGISELGDMKDKIEALERRGVYIPMELTPQQRAQFVTHILKHGI
jgi:hypothetical protein